jgi:hypothetical protein
MRSKKKTMLAALVAVLAFAAVAAASASAALPEFVPSTGAKFPIALSGSNGGAKSEFNVAGGTGFIRPCDGYKYKGDVTGAKTATLTTEFTNCQTGTTACNTAGAASGVIVLPGTASLVYVNKSSKQVALLLNVNELTVFCGALEVELKGNILAPVTPVNVKTSVLDLAIAGLKGKQKSYEYEAETGGMKIARFSGEGGAGWTETALNIEGTIDLATGNPLTIDA